MCMKKFDAEDILIPPTNWSFSGVYSFQHVHDPVIPSFHDSKIPSAFNDFAL